LRNGAPFRDWELPLSLSQLRQTLSARADGDRQFVGVLGAIATYGLEAVATACAEALAMGAASRDVVLNILGRTHDQLANPPVHNLPDGTMPPHLPVLTAPPVADCGRYDILLSEVATPSKAGRVTNGNGGQHAAG
jgi:hypothetical protein